MKKRPLIIVVLGILHLLEPLTKIVYLYLTLDFPFGVVVQNVLSIDHPLSFFEFWFLFPLAGVALLLVKKWSYIFFVAVQFYAIFVHITYEAFTWPYVSERPIFTSYLLLSVNCLLMLYFLFSKVKEPFLNQKMRWWEARKRFNVGLPCKIILQDNSEIRGAEIINISLSGAFIECPQKLEVGETIKIQFSLINLHLSLNSEVKNQHQIKDRKGHGVHFVYDNIWEHLDMRRFIKALKLLKA